MGKSFKKTPIIKYAGYGKFGKRQANKKVRRSFAGSGKGAGYRKVYPTWYINDMVFYWTRKDAEKIGMPEEWEKLYHRK